MASLRPVSFANLPTTPDITALRERLKNMRAPVAVSAGAAPTALQDTYKYTAGPTYQEKDFSGALPEFAQAREQIGNKLTSQANSAKQQQQDALARRFAAMGGLNTGAFIKQTELAEQQSQEGLSGALAEANTGLSLQEAAARRGLQQAEAQKSFQSGEAGLQRSFASGEAGAQRKSQMEQFNASLLGQYQQRDLQAQEFNTQASQQWAENVFTNSVKLNALDQSWKETQISYETQLQNQALAIMQGVEGPKTESELMRIMNELATRYRY